MKLTTTEQVTFHSYADTEDTRCAGGYIHVKMSLSRYFTEEERKKIEEKNVTTVNSHRL